PSSDGPPSPGIPGRTCPGLHPRTWITFLPWATASPGRSARLIAMHEGRRGMTPNALTCRTVLDLRCSNDKFISQTLLLAASWHRHCADHSALEVMCVGQPDELVKSFVEDMGATCLACG